MVEAEREFVADLVARDKPKNILEVGVSAGGSTVVLLDAVKERIDAHVTSVDIYSTWSRDDTLPIGWLTDLEHPNSPQWTLRAGKDFSEIADSFTEKFDFLLLDTMHAHPCESLNFLTILPYLTDDAMVVLHDIGLYSDAENTASNACKLLYDVVTAEKYECFDYSYELAAHVMNRKIYYPNIGAFRINSDTRKYIRDVFSMLRYPWGVQMNSLGAIRGVISQNYNDECLRLFKSAAAVNLSYLFCGNSYDFSSIGNVFCQIAANEQRVASALREFSRIIFYGAGNLCRTAIAFFEAFNFPMPAELWDKNTGKSSVGGYDVVMPDFKKLNETELVIVTIQNNLIAGGITGNRLLFDCPNVFTLYELFDKLITHKNT